SRAPLRLTSTLTGPFTTWCVSVLAGTSTGVAGFLAAGSAAFLTSFFVSWAPATPIMTAMKNGSTKAVKRIIDEFLRGESANQKPWAATKAIQWFVAGLAEICQGK